jgi:FixJ family two-component response regulator
VHNQVSCLQLAATHVFVVDDASFLTAVARMLPASGFAVKAYAWAEELLFRPDLDGPGCVPADLQMPGMSGLDLQEALAKAGHRLTDDPSYLHHGL